MPKNVNDRAGQRPHTGTCVRPMCHGAHVPDWASTLIARESLRRFDDGQEEGGFLQGLDLVIDRRFEHGNLSRPQV